jgi:hypothetical protein
MADQEDLLWGSLSDGYNEVVLILLRCHVNFRCLQADLRRWYRSAA